MNELTHQILEDESPASPQVANDRNYPTDSWLELLNFYLIVVSGGDLTSTDFDDVRLYEAYRENPGEGYEDMTGTATQLVLEFQAQKQDTEGKTARNGRTSETANDGFIPISLPHLPDHL